MAEVGMVGLGAHWPYVLWTRGLYPDHDRLLFENGSLPPDREHQNSLGHRVE
jgi:hypothetical protein